VIAWNGAEPELVVAWLFAAEPTDRALAGWSPQDYVRACYGSFLGCYAAYPPYPLSTAGETGGGAA